MGWLRETDERFERRPPDVIRCVAATIGVIAAGMWAQAQSSVDFNFFQAINALGSDLENLGKGLYYGCGSIWTVVGLAVLLLLFREVRMAAQVALAGAATWGIGILLNDILGDHSISGLAIHVRTGDGPTYPAVSVAIATAIALALSPYVVRPLRRFLALLVLLVALATMYLGAGLPSDVLGGLFLGTAVVALMRSVFGSPAGRPTIAEVRAAVTDLGYEVETVAFASDQNVRASTMDVMLADGRSVRVHAFGRDQRDASVGAKAWRRLMYKEPGVTVFGTRAQETEHIGYALLAAERAAIGAPRLERIGVGGSDIALVVTTPPQGRALSALSTDELTDDRLAAIWHTVAALHETRVSHGDLDGDHIIVQSDGSIAFDDFSHVDVSGSPYFANRDNAAIIAQTAFAIGHERSASAALGALGSDRVADAIPFLQPAALPAAVGHDTKHLGKVLKELRKEVAHQAGVEDVPALKIKRLDWANIGMLIGVLFALGIAISSLSGVDWNSVKGEFENATWGWAALALMLYPLVPTAWATALIGCVNEDLPFVPTVLTQLACTFLNLITPNGIGGTALQLDYLHKEGVPVASGASAMVLSTGVGGAIQMLLFLGAAAITATTVDTGGSSDSSGSTALIAIAVVAALVGIVLAVPKIRGKIVPAVKRAANDIWAVIRNPRKAMQLIGGDTAGNLIYPALLGLCLLAFHQHLDFAQLVVVQVGAGMVGNVAPVPGGVGVTEAALTGGLTAFGIAPTTALATVLVFRGITFAIPPIFGFFTLRWLRAQGYA